MKWPWQSKQKKTEMVFPMLDMADIAEAESFANAVATRAATQAATLAAKEAVGAAAEIAREEIARAMIAVSPMPGGPLSPADSNTGSQRSPYPLYSMNYPWQYFTPQAPTRRPSSLVAVEDLRLFADRYDILRSCIQHLKREVSAVPIKLVARDDGDTSEGMKARIKDAMTFFTARGGLGGFGRLRSEFEGMVIEDLCVTGHAALYFAPARGGWPIEVLVVDAATIRPRVDAYGWPGPGEKAYEQWVMGLKIGDGFTREEMSFSGLPSHARSYSPYCASPVEWLIAPIISAMKADEWNRTWLTDGNTPSDMIALPDTWTPGQVMEFTDWFNGMLTGNTKERIKTKFVPSGSSKLGNQSRRDQEFTELELWLARRTGAIMGVQLASIGFAGEQYKVSQENSMDSTTEFGAGVLLDYRKAVYDDILERLGFPDLECVNVTAQEEAAGDRAERLTKLVSGAVYTPNEARAAEGKDPIDGGDELFVPSTLRPLEQALIPPPDPLELAKANAAAAPGAGVGGAKPKPKAAAKTALRQWERKALNRLKGGKPADCAFESDALPEPLARMIALALPGQDTPEKVRSLFAGAEASVEESAPIARTFGKWEEIAARWRDGIDD
jgi:hypothetical protein